MTITASNHNMHNQGKDQRDKTNNRLLFVVAVVVMSMVGLAYASNPKCCSDVKWPFRPRNRQTVKNNVPIIT